MALRPLAPVFLFSANLAIATSAFFLNESFTPSIAKNCWNCLTTEFLGLVRISIKASSSSSSSEVWTAKRPTNSGMSPNFIRSSGSKNLYSSVKVFLSPSSFTLAENPIPVAFSTRLSITFPRPSNAPPQINKILEVSTSIVS